MKKICYNYFTAGDQPRLEDVIKALQALELVLT